MATKAPHDESRFVKDWGIPQDRVREYATSVRDGGFLLGVKARSAEDAQRLGQQWRAKGGALS